MDESLGHEKNEGNEDNALEGVDVVGGGQGGAGERKDNSAKKAGRTV